MPRDALIPGRRLSPTTRRRGKRVLIALFYIAIAFVLVSAGRKLDWQAAIEALRALPGRWLLLSAACSAACYAAYVGYELLAARRVGIALARRQIAAIGFVSYACNLNLGAILGALGVRLRLYGARDIDAADGARIVAFSLLTNWSGYLFVLGFALLTMQSAAPAAWRLDADALRLAGMGPLALGVAYLWACARASQRSLRVRGEKFELPSLRTALLQLALSIPAWVASAASLYFLLRGEVPFDLVILSLLASAVIGGLVHVPAGLGVLEAVFLASLATSLPRGQLLAALLAYRCVHYLVPLALGLATFAVLHRGSREASGASPKKPGTRREAGAQPSPD